MDDGVWSVVYCCDICDVYFVDSNFLQEHQHQHHTNNSLHTCSYCDRTFVDVSNLHQHTKCHFVETCGVDRSTLREDFLTFKQNLQQNTNNQQNFLLSSSTMNHMDIEQIGGMRDGEEHGDVAMDAEENGNGDGMDDAGDHREVDNMDDGANDGTDIIYAENRKAIESYYKHQRQLDICNVKVDDNFDHVRDYVLDHFDSHITNELKVNCSPGFILRHRTTGALRYFHTCINNHALFQLPPHIRTRVDMESFLAEISEMDLHEWIRQQRPDTSWVTHKLTNLTFYFYKLPQTGRVGRPGELPTAVKNNRSLVVLDRNLQTGQLYRDNLCFFRALSIATDCRCKGKCKCLKVKERHVTRLYSLWKRAAGLDQSARDFNGVSMDDLLILEKVFKTTITVYQLQENEFGSCIWRSKTNHPLKLNLNLWDRHFSLIKNISSYTKAFTCTTCNQNFTQSSSLKRHKCRGLEKRLRYPTGCYRPKQTVFDKIHDRAGIFIPYERRVFPYRITYDIESYMSVDDLPANTQKLEFHTRHKFLSVSVCSNVPGYEEPLCMISEGSDEELVERFINYMEMIQEASSEILMDSFQDVFQDLQNFIDEQAEIEKEYIDAGFSLETVYASRSPRGLKSQLQNHLKIIPVIGFNSSSYDLNVMKGPLMKHLHDSGKISFVIKRGSRLQCVTTDRFKFLDMMNYLTPGTSYAKYLRAFDVGVDKGFFPYEYVTSLDKLRETALPPHESFYSSLTRSNITVEEYELCQRVWDHHNMSSLADFLTWYNNLDVQPFLTAIKKQTEIYSSRKIDMFKDAVSIPGIAVQWKFNDLQHEVIDIPLITKYNKDLYDIVKANIVGGPSIIFHRHHEKGVTKIREETFGVNAKTCQTILGCDANALYLWSMMQEMPTGSPIRRRKSKRFKPEFADKYGRLACTWLEYLAHTSNQRIEHKFNAGEFRVGQHGLPVDGYCRQTNTVFQFHGCMFHGHLCSLTEMSDTNPLNGRSYAELKEDTEAKEKYIKRLGYKLITMRECEWQQILKQNSTIRDYIDNLQKRTLTANSPMTEMEIIEALKDGRFFGLIECDIFVPDNLKEEFSEMCPIFKNIPVSRADLEDHMRTYAEENGSLKQPQRMLIGSLFGKKILLLSSLAKWYVEHGLVITNIHQIIQYVPAKCFEKFGHSVSDARRQGDVDPSKSLLADTSKLIGNSVYGKMITNKERHKNVKYCSDHHKASRMIADKNFSSLEEIYEELYEVVSEKNTILLDIPVVLGFSVLQYAKLKMLAFYYDCISKYIERIDFQYCEMDTDSAYMALSDSFHRVIKPGLRQEFYERFGEWFPQESCENHRTTYVNTMKRGEEWMMNACCKKTNKHEQRTPGLFKEEFTGIGIISLNSKTYYCWSEEDVKYRSKGLSRVQNKLTREQFRAVLKERKPVEGVNRGFCLKNQNMLTYSQRRSGLTYLYTKRHVAEDGVSTYPLSI